MVETSCHCGAIRLEVETAPVEVTECNCSICRRYGTLWAYYKSHQVRRVAPAGTTDIYRCHDRELEFHRCASCGCVTHWAAGDQVGVNVRLMAPEVLARAKVRHFDGADTWKDLDD